MSVLAGIDVGGSKTALRVVDRAGGEVRADVSVATLDWRGRGWADKAAQLAALLRSHGAADAVAVGVGAHGCDTGRECRALQSALEQRTGSPARVVNDGQLLGLAAGHPDAIGLVCGTGSIAVGTTATGDTVHAGGAGWLLGDDGGATGLVREAVRAALAARDAGTGDRVLTAALLRASGRDSLSKLGMAMMVGRPEQWARYAPAVFEADASGSPLARRVVSAAVDSLVATVVSVARQGAVSDRVVVGGSVAAAQGDYVEEFRARLGAAAPHLSVTVLHGPPVAGAVQLARAAAPTGERLPSLPG
ncbi:N-acetylglucosamine kinase [Kineococcus sp. SYSU DK006]|uniref:N-acetylglucosamine kinase n=1 Tax=Kineococcus sp. SYSU DK006 TaxID=3383127 RepID=UPI003D7E86B5